MGLAAFFREMIILLLRTFYGYPGSVGSELIRATYPHSFFLVWHARLSGVRHGAFAGRKAAIDFSIGCKSRS